MVKNDGFYSAALLRFSGNGKFPLKVRATTEGGDEAQLVVGGDAPSSYRPNKGRWIWHSLLRPNIDVVHWINKPHSGYGRMSNY